MVRELVWKESPDFEGFSCSRCSWVFKPSDLLRGKSLDELKKDFEVRRDKEFAIHRQMTQKGDAGQDAQPQNPN